MDQPIASQDAPYAIEVTAGEEYYWCACGRSAKQPFCDGTHKGSSIGPIPFVAKETKKIYLCGCRRSGNLPFCDGTHSQR